MRTQLYRIPPGSDGAGPLGATGANGPSCGTGPVVGLLSHVPRVRGGIHSVSQGRGDPGSAPAGGAPIGTIAADAVTSAAPKYRRTLMVFLRLDDD